MPHRGILPAPKRPRNRPRMPFHAIISPYYSQFRLLREVWHKLCSMPDVTNVRGSRIIRTALHSNKLWHRSSLPVPSLVALTVLAAGAVLASAVNATFFPVAALAVGVLVFVGLAVQQARTATPGFKKPNPRHRPWKA